MMKCSELKWSLWSSVRRKSIELLRWHGGDFFLFFFYKIWTRSNWSTPQVKFLEICFVVTNGFMLKRGTHGQIDWRTVARWGHIHTCGALLWNMVYGFILEWWIKDTLKSSVLRHGYIISLLHLKQVRREIIHIQNIFTGPESWFHPPKDPAPNNPPISLHQIYIFTWIHLAQTIKQLSHSPFLCKNVSVSAI